MTILVCKLYRGEGTLKYMNIGRTQYRLSDFVSWQRAGVLSLSPSFQRRPVWKKDAKSFLVDTVVRGLPMPVIYLRERLNLDKQETVREVVDGQQRLRTLLGFVDESLLPDFAPQRDRFSVKKLHNDEVAGVPFTKLVKEHRERILGYEFSAHVLPTVIEDREVLQMFARLNATGVKLNGQELRNAEWFGEFKTSMYALALEQLDRWRGWGVLTEDQIARMKEVEITSDLVMSMIKGLTGKTQKRIDSLYLEFNEVFKERIVVEDRFRKTMNLINGLMNGPLKESIFTSEVHFFSLWVFIYDRLWGLGTALEKKKAKAMPSNLEKALRSISESFSEQSVPRHVLDAVQRASADQGRREMRLDYMRSVCDA